MKFALTISDLDAAELFGIQQACDGLTQGEPIDVMTQAGVTQVAESVAMQAAQTVTAPLAPVVAPPAPLQPAPIGDNAIAPPALSIPAPIGDNAIAPPALSIPAPVASPAAAVDVDGDGVAYDPTIHATPATKTVKGTWRKKRKAKADAAAPPVAPIQTPETVPMPDNAPATVAAPVAPVAAPVAPVAAPVAAPAPAAPGDFVAFMAHVSGQMGVQGPDGLPLVSVEVLASVTGEISQAFQTPLSTITDIQKDPRADQMVVYATQVLQRDGRW